MNYTKADVNDLEANLAWQEITLRIENMLTTNDSAMENPDSFEHGKAVGERQVLRTMKNMPAELRRVAEKGKPETKLR